MMVAAVAYSKSRRWQRAGEGSLDRNSEECAVDPNDKFLLDKIIWKYFFDLYKIFKTIIAAFAKFLRDLRSFQIVC